MSAMILKYQQEIVCNFDLVDKKSMSCYSPKLNVFSTAINRKQYNSFPVVLTWTLFRHRSKWVIRLCLISSISLGSKLISFHKVVNVALI